MIGYRNDLGLGIESLLTFFYRYMWGGVLMRSESRDRSLLQTNQRLKGWRVRGLVDRLRVHIARLEQFGTRVFNCEG